MNKFTGIDISKQTFDCNITLEDGKIVSRKLSNNSEGFIKLKKLLPVNAHVVMEASGPYYYKLAFFLFNNGVSISIVNPLVIRRFCQMRMIRTKTDKKDATMIREYGITENPVLWSPDEPSITKLKQLNAAIELLDKQSTATQNQLEAMLEMPDTDKSLINKLKRIIEYLNKQKEILEREMEKISIEKYSDSYKALQTIPGIGPKTASMLIAISGNFKKFNNHKQLLAYIGLNPRVFESGTSIKGKGHISKMGTGRLRKLLYLCAWSAKRHNVYCKELYERLKAKAKPERVIKIAIANKLLRQAFAIGKNFRKYENNYQLKLAN